MNESKQRTCDALAATLRTTRQFSDLIRLDYIKDEVFEVVIPVFEGGNGNPINVHLDSCWALIKDVIRGLEG
jgi:hypothetical protein